MQRNANESQDQLIPNVFGVPRYASIMDLFQEDTKLLLNNNC
jgi:hypothetical protein